MNIDVTHSITKGFQPTDFASLQAELQEPQKPPVHRTVTDWMIDIITPMLIFFMVCAVGFFLLDVRYVYTGVNDISLRMVLFFFTLGIVALNRLIATEDTGKSYVYFTVLAIVITFYTLSISEGGTVARDFMSYNQFTIVLFNLTIMAFFWWMVNRLTYECCIDENIQSGEVGLMTGAIRQWREKLTRDKNHKEQAKQNPAFVSLEEAYLPTNIIEPYDPTDPESFSGKNTLAQSTKPTSTNTQQAPPKRHPGISVFYFSVPVMIIFTLGLRVIQHGEAVFLRRGDQLLLTYTFSALILLLLTSLGGLRAYFRTRQISMPAGIGCFWIAIGLVMVIYVIVFAMKIPGPGLPPIAQIDRHDADAYFYDPDFTIKEIPEVLAPSPFMERLQTVSLVVLGVFLLIGIPRGIAALIKRLILFWSRIPAPFKKQLFAMEKLLLRVTNIPKFSVLPRRIRIQKNIAMSSQFDNPYAHTATVNMPVRDQIIYAYTALCALAQDLGVPRALWETPLEFIEQFPKELATIEPEARDLTQLFLISAYTDQPLDEKALRGRLQQFWVVYRRLRNRVTF